VAERDDGGTPLTRPVVVVWDVPWRRRAAPVGADALHLAVAATTGMHFLCTWNCRHLANAMIRGKIESACVEFGLVPPIVCTPEQLREVDL
jgi:hypothetical protein